MSEWAGMNPTGRRISGSAADLVELDDGSDGLKHTAIVFHERYRTHPLLNRGVELVRSFLEFPMVAGLCEMKAWMPEKGVFIYPTGTTWTAGEVIRAQREGGKGAGSKATLEMLYLAGMILQEAAETGPVQGCFSHGALSPMRLMFKEDGQVQIIGYGLPQVELAVWREDPSMLPNDDAFRYAPPERLRGDKEDGDADLFALSLMAYEFLVNEPLYDGSVDQIRAAAAAGDAVARLDKAAKAKKVAGPVRDLLAKALAPNPEQRHENPAAFVGEVEGLLSAISSEGLTLADLMNKVRTESRRSTGLAVSGRESVQARGVPVASASQTMAFRKGPVGGIPIATFAGSAAPAGPRPSAAPPGDEGDEEGTGQSRWSKPARGGEDGESESPRSSKLRDRARARGDEAPAAPAPKAPEPAPAPADDARAKLRDRLRNKGAEAAEPAPAPAPAAEPAPAPAEDKSAARDALRDRLRRSSGTPTEPPPAEPTPAPVEAAPAPQPAASPAPAPEPPKEEAPKADARDALRDRLRRGREEKAAEPAAAAPAPTPAPAPAAAAPAPAPAPPPADDKKVDPREALRQRLKQRREGE